MRCKDCQVVVIPARESGYCVRHEKEHAKAEKILAKQLAAGLKQVAERRGFTVQIGPQQESHSLKEARKAARAAHDNAYLEELRARLS